MSDDSTTDIDQRLQELTDATSEHRSGCRHQSAMHTSRELQRIAKSERRLIDYLTANFFIMNVAQDLFDAEASKAAAIENIALLESPERARAFQSDYDEGQYEGTVQWLSACSYDNLALATGMLSGFNSPGMQSCIADGIQVCRRTGKLKCIACFREYATRVHRSGDDLAMALHHGRTNRLQPPVDKNNDRRFVGASDEAGVLLLSGQLDAAREAAQAAMALSAAYHTPMRARRIGLSELRTIGYLANDAQLVEMAAIPDADRTPVGEDPAQDLRDDLASAIGAAVAGDLKSAIQTLTPWDRRLSDRKALSDWFEVRLRLIAAYKLAGESDRAAALSGPLETKARGAADFLTLRRLQLIKDGSIPLCPMPLVGPLIRGVVDPESKVVVPPAAALPSTVAMPTEPTPLEPLAEAFGKDLVSLLQNPQAEPAEFVEFVERMLAIAPSTVTHSFDASRLIHMLTFVAMRGVPDARIWEWAQTVAAAHSQSPPVISLQALLGNTLRQLEDPELSKRITIESLEALFRRAMDLDPNYPRSFSRAGAFFLNIGNDAEAERCLARAFRLDRTDTESAEQLADVYAATDRPADALAAMDLCIREGGATPGLLWKASVRASLMGHHESALSYLARFEQELPGQQWTNYYRSISLLGLGRFEDASAAIEAEAARSESPHALHLDAIRAAAAAGANRTDDVRRHLTDVVATSLPTIENLTRSGIAACHEHVWTALSNLPQTDPVRPAVEDRLLESGLTPDGFWHWYRTGPGAKSTGPVQNLTHFLCDFVQPLDERWAQSPSCPPGQSQWRAYQVRYGVLAPSEDEARETALAWQARCAPLAPEVLAIAGNAGPFTDRPGVTWRTTPEELDMNPPDGSV